jgi:hypothetical protein
MIRLAVVAGATLLGAIACTDDPQRALTPTAPAAPALAKAPVGPTLRTTVCLSYMRERVRLEVRLAASPDDSTLRKKAASYDRMFAGACR